MIANQMNAKWEPERVRAQPEMELQKRGNHLGVGDFIV